MLSVYGVFWPQNLCLGNACGFNPLNVVWANLKSLLSSPISNSEDSMDIYISRIKILANKNMVREMWSTCTTVGYIVHM